MALDKQRILNELGSVVNQLQSADCGCMGKLFSNQSGGQGGGALGNHLPSGGFEGGMHSGWCSGHSGSNRPCMGGCNPRKAYADTYGYLNHNLMQPVVNEVYNDLKTITPQNTVMNNAMAGNMGLASQGGRTMQGGNPMQGDPMQGGNSMHVGYSHVGHPMLRGHPNQEGNSMQDGNPMQGDMGMPQNQMIGNYMGNQMQENVNVHQNQMQNMGYQMPGTMPESTGMPPNEMQRNTMGYQIQGNTGMPQNQMMGSGMENRGMPLNPMTNQKMARMMGGMGPQIVNMMKSDSTGKSMGSTPREGQMPGSMLIDAPQSPHGTIGVTPMNTTGGMYQGQFNANAGMENHSNQHTYNMTNADVAGGGMPSTQNYNGMNANMQPGQGNPGAQQMSSGNRNYGQHNQGISKFNEMFPGVMQGTGGNLGFDPMAIAIQMNPENQKRSAMDVMQKMMFGNSAHTQNAVTGANAAAANINQGSPTTQQNVPLSNQENVLPSNQQALIRQPGSDAPPMAQNHVAMAPVQPNQVYNANQVPQQQIYTATGTPTLNQGQASQQMEAQQQQYQQQISPNTTAPMQQTLPPGNQEATGDGQVQKEPAVDSISEMGQLMIQDPIYPVDNSRFHPPPSMRRTKYYQYNTLGQPVEMLPARLFHSVPETNLPQTLSPEPGNGKLRKDVARFNLKSTVSKTSLMGNKPVGRTSSRGQLQNIYNQYKGSNSYTQQNVRVPDNGASYSEGKIGVVQQRNENQAGGALVERVGGDTAANNQVPVKGQPMHNIGDVPVSNKPHGDIIPMKESPMMQRKCRNGLQDMIYTSYPTSAAWSFHGDAYEQRSYAFNHKFRNRA